MNGRLRELCFPLQEDADLIPVTTATNDGSRIYRLAPELFDDCRRGRGIAQPGYHHPALDALRRLLLRTADHGPAFRTKSWPPSTGG